MSILYLWLCSWMYHPQLQLPLISVIRQLSSSVPECQDMVFHLLEFVTSWGWTTRQCGRLVFARMYSFGKLCPYVKLWKRARLAPVNLCCWSCKQVWLSSLVGPCLLDQRFVWPSILPSSLRTSLSFIWLGEVKTLLLLHGTKGLFCLSVFLQWVILVSSFGWGLWSVLEQIRNATCSGRFCFIP